MKRCHGGEGGRRAPELGQRQRQRRPGEGIPEEQQNARDQRDAEGAGVDADVGLELDPRQLHVIGDEHAEAVGRLLEHRAERGRLIRFSVARGVMGGGSE